MLAVQARIAVPVVRVVRADFRGFMGRRDETRKVRVSEFQVHFQGNAQQPGEIAKALGTGLHIGRRFATQYLLAAAAQLLAKEVPALTADNLLIDPVCNHACNHV
ncbi:hypothetical protein D3C84_989160 [compost metagenome]